MNPGDTFLFDGSQETRHLWVVVTDERPNGIFLAVCVTTWKEELKNDDSCVLNNGDHPFIQRKSYIAYRHTKPFLMNGVENLKNQMEIFEKEPVSTTLFKRILAGALKSKFMSGKNKKIIQDYISDKSITL